MVHHSNFSNQVSNFPYAKLRAEVVDESQICEDMTYSAFDKI